VQPPVQGGRVVVVLVVVVGQTMPEMPT